MKPSERIKEIADKSNDDCATSKWICAVVEYLDEQWEKEQKECKHCYCKTIYIQDMPYTQCCKCLNILEPGSGYTASELRMMENKDES